MIKDKFIIMVSTEIKPAFTTAIQISVFIHGQAHPFRQTITREKPLTDPTPYDNNLASLTRHIPNGIPPCGRGRNHD